MSELRDFLDPRQVAQLEKLQIVARRVVEGFLRGFHRSPAKGTSLEYAENRPYVPGDDLRRLDWRGVAKTDRYYVRQFEDETNLRATLVIDASASMQFGSNDLTKLRYVTCLAAALGYLLHEQRDAVGLALVDGDNRSFEPCKSTAEHLAGLFDTMDRIEARGETRFQDLLPRLAERVPRKSLVVLLSDLLDDSETVLSGLAQLRQRGAEVLVFHVMDPAELELLFDSWMVFRDPERPASELRLDAREMREIYLENLEEHRRALRRGCASSGIDYLFLDTSEPFESALAKFLHLRGTRR